MPAFGAPKGEVSERFALSLGDALQLTNILRDVAEDAAIGRLYLPTELLVKHGAPARPADILTADDGARRALAAVKEEIAGLAREKFAATRDALRSLDWRVVRPALLMMGVYEAHLDRMTLAGFEAAPRPMTKLGKLAIAARWYLAPKLR